MIRDRVHQATPVRVFGLRPFVRERLHVLLRALEHEMPQDTPPKRLLAELDGILRPADPTFIWLSLSVLSGRLPREADVLRTLRAAELDGPVRALASEGMFRRPGLLDLRDTTSAVEVVTDAVVVDVQHTARTSLATGIQRVARETVRRWADSRSIILAGWKHGHGALRRLDADESRQALHGGRLDKRPNDRKQPTVLVPWRSTYLLPELATESDRTSRILALARFSGCATGVIGFDCVPLTTAETVADGMGAGFASNLSAVKYMARLAAISDAAASEYRGWRAMLAGAGLSGPRIEPITLPVEALEPTASVLEEARKRLVAGDMPMVLVVGSHEPRKNHLAVLHAAELVWRRGRRFSVVFVGGNAWNSDSFSERLTQLQEVGRPVESMSALSDELLWSAYRSARCVLFPSLNEGYGLPVAEALASGTPVITSDFGSMADIVTHGGALPVDPRDDHDIAEALDRLLSDDELHANLAEQALRSPRRTWDEYADRTWNFLVGGTIEHPTDRHRAGA